jgi:myo-inositol-1(or 4)-monophosphatase
LPESDDLALIREAAAEGAAIAMRYFRKSPDVFWKGSSPVTEADYAVDRFLRETLTAARPDYGWLSEETADSPERLERNRAFVVDPIDGTRGFMEGKTTWCVSVAVVEAGRPVAGVLDCPATGEVFMAALGGGATLDGQPIAVAKPSDRPVLAGPRVMVEALDPSAATHPYIPSLAYRLALVASGRIHATFVKENSHDWDLAAADLILTEAGGEVVDSEGRPLIYNKAGTRHGRLAAGSGALLDGMTAVLRRLP